MSGRRGGVSWTWGDEEAGCMFPGGLGILIVSRAVLLDLLTHALQPSRLCCLGGCLASHKQIIRHPYRISLANLPPSLQLSAQTTTSTLSQSRSAANTIAGADAEIARFKDIMRQIDELEMEFDKVRHIRDIVKGFRARVEGLGGRLGRR